MPIPASGPVSIQALRTEFGGGTPSPLTNYYRGAGLVANTPTNAAVPTSGPISLGQFYGAANRVQAVINITTNQSNYVFNTAKVAGYVAGQTDVVFNIASGVYLSATSTGVFAGDVDTSWAAGDTVTINNNGGFIIGMGGAGGAGSASNSNTGSAGATGGPALRAQRPVSINNTGTIASGGGGGGGGGGWANNDGKIATQTSGGGGGGGRSSASANSAGGPGGPNTANSADPGGAGTVSGAGSGGIGRNNFGVTTSTTNGGSGGGWGAAGSAGLRTSSGNVINSGPYSGGGAGNAVQGNANITWISTGTRLGGII